MNSGIGILSYKNNSGIGNIARTFEKYLEIDDFFVVNFPEKPLRTDWLNGNEYFGTGALYQTSDKEIRDWFKKSQIKKLLLIETPFNWNLFDIAKEFGIEVFSLIHWECFRNDKRWHKATKLISNTKCGVEYVKKLGFENIEYISYPVDLEFKQRVKAEKFLYVYGYGGVWDRKNLKAVIEVQRRLNFPLLIRTQVPLDIRGENIEVRYENIDDYKDLYIEGDVLLYPTKFEGLGLIILEAMASGIPVITTDAPPMNEYIREEELLVKVERKEQYTIYSNFDGNLVDIDDFEGKIKAIRDKDISFLSQLLRERIEKEYCWKVVKEQYWKILSSKD